MFVFEDDAAVRFPHFAKHAVSRPLLQVEHRNVMMFAGLTHFGTIAKAPRRVVDGVDVVRPGSSGCVPTGISSGSLASIRLSCRVAVKLGLSPAHGHPVCFQSESSICPGRHIWLRRVRGA